MKALRQEFADTLQEVGKKDPRLVVLVGDISHGILQNFAKTCPGRYFNIGICEPSIVNIAAGIAKSGCIPVVHTIAPFIVERAYEQIKLDFGYQNLGVNLITVGSAFDYSQLGCSHHCYTDFSLIGHFKEACIFHPASPVEFNILFKQSYANGKINYFRLTEHPHGMHFSPEQIEIGVGILVKKGTDLTLVAIGAQLKNALCAAEYLKQNGASAEVLYFPTIQPLDYALLRKSALRTGRLLVVEEASAYDGVFNRIVKATLSITPLKYAHIAIEGFMHGYGTYKELCAQVGLSTEGIVRQIRLSFPEILSGKYAEVS